MYFFINQYAVNKAEGCITGNIHSTQKRKKQTAKLY